MLEGRKGSMDQLTCMSIQRKMGVHIVRSGVEDAQPVRCQIWSFCVILDSGDQRSAATKSHWRP
jgi:hypothetical protein